MLEFLGFVLDFSSTKLYLICCSCRHFSYLLVHAQQFFAIFQLITNDFVWLLNGLVRNNVSIASSFDSSNSNLMNSSSHYTPTCDAIFSRLFKFSCFVIDAAVADFNRLLWGYFRLLQVKSEDEINLIKLKCLTKRSQSRHEKIERNIMSCLVGLCADRPKLIPADNLMHEISTNCARKSIS